ncbi:HAD family hydrolase [Salibacterium salarium]|uniref:HAD family hydrolase n=1 Tax=Salibacterium salarium TaxID=284579 RepID=A0A3R9QQ62_9BACI|nr:HAD-IA family hydrolase [Salibacterium salarium]RSL30931.1 HAD family hydrolase [Salibacterium salarium]
MRWNTICFDLDNTLFSHEKAFERAIQHTFENKYLKNKDIPYVDKKQWFETFKRNCDYYWHKLEENKLTHDEYRKVRFDETMKTFGLPFGELDAKEFHDEYEDIVVQYSIPFQGMSQLLSSLYQADINLGIITNGRQKTQERKIKQLKTDDYIPRSQVIISEDVGIEKPDKGIFDYALNKINGDKSSALFIGDSWHLDVMGAIHAGWDAVFLNTRAETRSSSDIPVAEHYDFQETVQFLLQSLHLKG